VFQELPRAEHWRKFGEATLVHEMQSQVSTDGVYCELSSYYHCYAADFYLHALILARSNGIALPDWMWSRLNQMLEFVMHFTRPDGTIPLLGDDDGGRVLMWGARDYRSYRDGLCSGAVLFQRGDFKHQALEFSEDTLWLLGPEAWPLFNAIPIHASLELSKSYVQAGYFVQRSGWGAADSHLVFDCGGLGAPSGGHGHADSLSFTLFSGGHDLLIDPGTSVYNCQPDYREYFRSTAAHNSVVVDGMSQSRTRGTFDWKAKASATLLSQFSLQDIEYVDGEHDGYVHLGNGITHRRRIIYIRPDYWIVLDELGGTGEHQFDFLYHFGPESKLNIFGDENRGEVDCRASSGKAGLQLFLYASDSIRADAVGGQQRPIQGWSSERYGERRPSSVLRASIRGIAPVSMMSFLIPGKEATVSRRFKGNSRQTIAAAVRVGDYDDIVVMAVEDGDLQIMDCEMRGEFFWLRTQNGNLRRLLAANARFFRHAGETVFDSPQAIPYVQAHFWDDGIVIEKGERDSAQQVLTNQGKVYVRDLRDRQFQRY
jgi:Heparinase II/III-like protein/Heparinase II/III N-terminus